MSAPVLDSSFDPSFAPVSEGAANPVGTTVAALVVDGSITDPDGSSVEAIAITGLNTSLGAWQYSLDAGASWLTIQAEQINSSTNELALLLGPTAMVRLLPYGELHGTLSDAITFRAWDQSVGTEGVYSIIEGPGNASPFSSGIETVSVSVSATNDAPTFFSLSGAGVIVTDIADLSIDHAQSIVLQPDGKILVGGASVSNNTSDFALVRFHSDGRLDTDFNGNGKVLTDFASGSWDSARTVTLQSDGKILVAGFSTSGLVRQFALARYNPDGSLDTSFGGTGKLLTGFGTSSNTGVSVDVLPDGKVVMTGYADSFGANFAVVRYNADGTLDTEFNGTGKVTTNFGDTDTVSGSAVQSDGKILVGGIFESGYSRDFALVRYNTDGSLDTSFNGTGKVLTNLAPFADDRAASVVLQLDGKIIVGGYAAVGGSDYDFALVRHNADGSLDTSFNGTGKVLTDMGSTSDTSADVVLAPGGKVIVAGYTNGGGNNDNFAIARYNADGSLDTTFNVTGKVTFDVGNSSIDIGRSVTLQPDGKILVAGFTNRGGSNNFALIRLNDDGSLDTSFGASPANTLGGTVAYLGDGNPVALDPSVAIFDAELTSLDAGIGNYGGSSVVVCRVGGANADDIFVGMGNVSFEGNVASVAGTAVGAVSNTDGTLSIAFNDSATQARVNEVLSSIGYVNVAATSTASVDIEFRFSDGNGGVQGSGDPIQVAGTVNVQIAIANAAPVLDNTVSQSLGEVLEGDHASSGTSIAAMLLAGSVADFNAPATEAIAITALNTSLGAWQYSLDGGANWLTVSSDLVNSDANELALLLGPSARLRLLPFGDLTGQLSDAITFRAWDQSEGTEGQYVSIASTGGGSSFSEASDTAEIGVVPQNDAPSFSMGSGASLPAPIGFGDQVGGAAFQADGKVVVVGSTLTLVPHMVQLAVARFNLDGSVDSSFNGTGHVLVDVAPAAGDMAHDVLIQPDGKVLVAGVAYHFSGTSDFALTRLNSDGTLDTTFNGTGKLFIDFAGHDAAWAVALQLDGKVLLTGYIGPPNEWVIARLNADGSLDTTFNETGKLVLHSIGFNATGSDIAVQADGKILVSGTSYSHETRDDFALVRLNADGSADTSFNGTGLVVTDLGSMHDRANAITVLADGKILVVGGSSLPDHNIVVIRYNPDGTLDTSLNGSGVVVTDVGNASMDSGGSVSVMADGRFVVAGGTDASGPAGTSIVLVRYHADGSLDTSFNQTGKVLTHLGPYSFDAAAGVSVQPDGQIVVGAYSNIGGQAFAVLRYNADGSLDSRFDESLASTVNGSPIYLENEQSVGLDNSVAIHDVELATLNGGAGNYSGASVTLNRNSGASTDDVFSAKGNLALAGGDAVLSGVTIGNYSNASGTLAITFNANATQTRVNEALSSIGYANASDVPPTIVQIDWNFTDGNVGAQGTGGSLMVLGSTTVLITSLNDSPTGGVTTAGTPTQGETLTAANTLADVEGLGTITYQWKANGIDIGGATGATYVLTQAEVGKAITVLASYIDGESTAESVLSATTSAVANINDAPTGAVTIAGTAVHGQTLTASNTLADADGIGTITYQWMADGADIVGGTGTTYALTLADVGKAITVTAGYTDLSSTVESVTSAPTAAVAVTLTGTAVADALSGGAGNDFLSGLAGNDTLTGMAGDDTLSGDSGIDVLDGQEGSDLYVLAVTADHTAAEFADQGTTGFDEVRLVGTKGGTLTLFAGDTGIERVVIGTGLAATADASATNKLNVNASAVTNALSISGNAGVNTLTGTAFNDTLDGGAGADKLIGGSGNDTYFVDNTKDSITEALLGGTDLVQSLATYTLAVNVENLVLAGEAAINGIGNALENSIVGNGAANLLDGKAGTDTLDGAEGADVYIVASALDHVAAEFADSGSEGADEVRFSATVPGTLTLFSGDTGIERVVIGTGTAAIAVTTKKAALNVDAFAVLNALAISGNAGANIVAGTAFNDSISGAAGADTLNGNDGDDVISGGIGSDSLTGGAGADRFVFDVAPATSGKDSLTDFESGLDKVVFSTAAFAALGAPGVLDASQFWSGEGVTAAHDADDRIVYNTTTGVLYYDADGSGGVGAIQIAIMGTGVHPAVVASDIEVVA
jgi:uncharacterized delta-60 repeat protein